MLDEILNKYFPDYDNERVFSFLVRRDFQSGFRKNQLSNGRFAIKIKWDGGVIARSCEFDSKETRNRVMDEMIDAVHVEIHKDTQRSFNF